MKWSVLVLGAGCWGSAAPTTTPPKPSAPPTILWTVRVFAPEGVADFNFLTVESVVAGRGDRPTMFAHALFDTDKPTATARTDPPRPAYGELIGAELGAGAITVTTLASERRAIPYTTVPEDATWYDLAPGLLAISRSAAGVKFARFDAGIAPTWVVDVADSSVSEVRRVGWFANGDPLIAIDHTDNASLIRLELARHATAAVATVPRGAVALAERANRIAVVFTKVTADCKTCDSAAIYDLAGRPMTEFRLARPGDRTVDARDRELGFDGRLLWMYGYYPAHYNHGIGGPESCGYEAYDVAAGKRVRTLADARGDWARLTKDCAVRALLPTADGGALAFVVVGVREARVVKFAAPP